MIRVRNHGSRRKFLALATAVAAISLTGCGGGEPGVGQQPFGATSDKGYATSTPPRLLGVIPLPAAPTFTPTPVPTVVRFAHWEVGPTGLALAGIADMYMRGNPRAIVRTEVSSFGSHFQKLQESAAAGSAPDVFVSSGAFSDELLKATVPADLADRVAADGLDLNAYWSEPVVSQNGGHLYALPIWAAVDLVFLNLDRLGAAGVPAPSVDWTWTDFLAAARKTTIGKPGEISRWGTMIVNDLQGGWGSFVATNRGRWVEPGQRKVALDPPAVEALRWVADAILVNHVAPTPSEQHALTHGGTIDPFLSGNIAIMPSGSWEIASALNQTNLNWDVVTMPRATASGTSAAIGSVQPVCLAKSGQSVDLSWQFVKFLLGREVQQRLAIDKVRLPALKEVATDASAGYSTAPPGHIAAAVTAMKSARDLGFTGGWQGFRAAVVSALDRAFDGRVSLEEAVALAATNGNAALAKVG